MKMLGKALLRGFGIVLPVAVTLQLLYWLISSMEGWAAPILQAIITEHWYFPGLGLITFLAIVFIIGFSANTRGIRSIWQLPGKVLLRIPGASQLYGMLQEIIEVMSGKNFADESVVLVKLPQSDVELIGIVTKKAGIKGDRMSGLLEEEQLAVFLPMAYNVGGYTIIVPKSCTRNVDMKPAEALQLVMTGGLGKMSGP
ncbi:DUF502 domain-containing protein [Aliidiomarina celeris]|uniref:DUF502 domain-containing protein n=1 Tax=Aliidiomarina celeris TaxID=2249428 RepID=UPI000DEBE6BC|nr:DUF502 domain-containing protein [Aliidiomarina celeris]